MKPMPEYTPTFVATDWRASQQTTGHDSHEISRQKFIHSPSTSYLKADTFIRACSSSVGAVLHSVPCSREPFFLSISPSFNLGLEGGLIVMAFLELAVREVRSGEEKEDAEGVSVSSPVLRSSKEGMARSAS